MFNVLDKDGKKIKVAKVDTKLHKHISGRDFTKDDNVEFVSIISKVTNKKPLVSKKK